MLHQLDLDTFVSISLCHLQRLFGSATTTTLSATDCSQTGLIRSGLCASSNAGPPEPLRVNPVWLQSLAISAVVMALPESHVVHEVQWLRWEEVVLSIC